MDRTDLANLMSYDGLCARIYSDPRVKGNGVRNLLLTLGWVVLRDPARRFGDAHWWKRWTDLVDGVGDDRSNLRSLIADDAPRYQPDRLWAGRCEGPRMRAYRPRGGSSPHPDDPRCADDRVCGDRAREYCVERDPVTGWHTQHWFCPRHRDRLDEVRRRYAAMDAPDPIPNRGGLLPSYFTCSSWEEVYAWASPYWKPPTYGLRADDWPDPDTATTPVRQPRRPRLSVITGGLATATPEEKGGHRPDPPCRP